MERKIFVCDCQNLEHQISFWYDEEDDSIYVETHLITHNNFFKRMWIGIKYTFGYKSRFGNFDEVILGPESQEKLLKILFQSNLGRASKKLKSIRYVS